MAIRTKFITSDTFQGPHVFRGTILIFENIGDTLGMHKHGPDTIHITVVTRGSFRVHGPEIGEHILKAGDWVDWSVGASHEFIAQEPDSHLGQLLKQPFGTKP